jgi:hypothetical protein
MRLISCGAKVFVRHEKDPEREALFGCSWRVPSDGALLMRSFMGSKRFLKIDPPTFEKLMKKINIGFGDLEKEIQEKVMAMEAGCLFAELEPWAEMHVK